MFKQILSTAAGITLAASLFAGHAEAGMANADFHCISKNNKVTVSGNIPGDSTDFELAFQENGTSMTLSNNPEKEGADRVFVHEDFKLGVFAVAVSLSNGYDFMLYGVPQSVQKSANRKSKRFQAILQTAPRPSLKTWNTSNDFFHHLAMTCTYKYEV